MWWLIAIVLFVILMALSPSLASAIAALVFVGVLVWRSALYC